MHRAEHVGTAGWSISSHYKRRFPGSGTHLERYARRLNAVEINSSFYRHHQAQTYARWAASVPASFRFAVKVPRTLTHDGELLADPEILDRFAAEIAGLGRKLAVLLVQLPPKLEFDEPAVRHFFAALRTRIDVRTVCEPRHASWSSREADSVLAGCTIARVAADPAPWPGAGEPGGATELAYFRWHGRPRKYYSDYDEGALALLRNQMTLASASASDVWAVFDNTALGHASGNALAIAEPPASTKARKRRPAKRKKQLKLTR